MKKILVTGATGQLGKCIKDISEKLENLDFFFADKNELDISNSKQLQHFFNTHNFDFCINTAAYTNVEKAESDEENAFLVNAEAVKQLALHCEKKNIVLIHISTDYVFDGTKTSPYVETDKVNPISVYGASKLSGEEYIQEVCNKYFIIRTSWLYSQYGHNFFKSILRFAEEKDQLTITTEQTGVPTNANDLANALVLFITNNVKEYGIYHFSNKGAATWYDFAQAIVASTGYGSRVKVVKTDYYPTFAKRPKYSVMSTNKIEKTLGIETINWEHSLQSLLN